MINTPMKYEVGTPLGIKTFSDWFYAKAWIDAHAPYVAVNDNRKAN